MLKLVNCCDCFPYPCSMWQFAVDLLIEVYKITFHEMGGYIVNTEKVPNRCQTFILSMAAYLVVPSCNCVATENRSEINMLRTSMSQGWKSSFRHCPWVKRKFSLKDLNCDRYVNILVNSVHLCQLPLLHCLFSGCLQKLLCRIHRQAAENEWKEINSDNVVGLIAVTKWSVCAAILWFLYSGRKSRCLRPSFKDGFDTRQYFYMQLW
jgi:hypothetical protein